LPANVVEFFKRIFRFGKYFSCPISRYLSKTYCKFSLSFDVTKHPFCCLPKKTPCSCLFSAGSPNFFIWGPHKL